MHFIESHLCVLLTRENIPRTS